MTTIAAIAQELGISKSTVSRALRGVPGISRATVESVLQVAERDGYVPSVNAAGLSTGRNHAIGVVVPSLTRWFYTTVLSGIDDELGDTGFDVVLFDLSRTPEDRGRVFHHSLLRKRVDGLVVLSTEFTEEEEDQLEAIALPVVAVGGPAGRIRRIGVDDTAIARTATQHLIDLGHTAIGSVGGYDAQGLNLSVPARRRESFARTMSDAGLPLREQWLLEGGYRLGIAKDRVARWLEEVDELPTALVCMSDEMAIGAICAIREAGLSVPGDISIIGIDGHEYAEAFGLTTCEQYPSRQGIDAARVLVSEIRGHVGAGRESEAPFTLVTRGSTAPPQALARPRRRFDRA